MAFELGARCFLEGTNQCTVMYCGTTAFSSGVWYGVEMDDATLGKNDGSIDGVQYFQCKRSTEGGLFVRRGRLSESSRTRDTLDIALRRGSAPDHSFAQGGPAKPPLRKAKSFNKRARVKSSVNPREIQQALEGDKRQKRLDKRARNMTIDMAIASRASPTSLESDASSKAVHAREADMRKEIMSLQKEHLKTLIAENKSLNETNDMLVAHVASIESKYAQTVMKNLRIEGRLSEIQGVDEGESPYEEAISERDLAVQKLSEVTTLLKEKEHMIMQLRHATSNSNQEIQCLKQKTETQVTEITAGLHEQQHLQKELQSYVDQVKGLGDIPKHLDQLTVDNNNLKIHLQQVNEDLKAARAEVELAQSENIQLRQTIQQETVDVSNCMQPSKPSASSRKRLFDNQSPPSQFQKQTQQPQESVVNDALRRKCELAEQRIQKLTVLISKLSNRDDGVSAAVLQATSMPFDKQEAEFGRIAEKLNWDDLDAEVLHQNKEMDKSFSSPTISPTSTSRVGYGGDRASSAHTRYPHNAAKPDVVQSFAAIRARLSNRLQSVLHQSNSIRIRSNAVTPSKYNTYNNNNPPSPHTVPTRISYSSNITRLHVTPPRTTAPTSSTSPSTSPRSMLYTSVY